MKRMLCILLTTLFFCGCQSAIGSSANVGSEAVPAPTSASIEMLLADALNHCKAGNYEEAILSYEMILEIEPNNYDANLGLGQAYDKIDCAGEAIAFLKYAATLEMNTSLTSQEVNQPDKTEDSKAQCALRAIYHKELMRLRGANASPDECKLLFEEWLSVRYGSWMNAEQVQLSEKEIISLQTLESLTVQYEFIDLASLTETQIFFVVPCYYIDSYKNCPRYGFNYIDLVDTDDEAFRVPAETVQSLLLAVYNRGLDDANTSPSLSDPCIDGVYFIGNGDSGESSTVLSQCIDLGDETYYVIFDMFDPFDETLYPNQVGLVVQRASDSAFGFHVIARRSL